MDRHEMHSSQQPQPGSIEFDPESARFSRAHVSLMSSRIGTAFFLVSAALKPVQLA